MSCWFETGNRWLRSALSPVVPKPKKWFSTIENMSAAPFVEECLSVLSRTPTTLNALLLDLPDVWTTATEGPGTWSPYDVIGHLIHGEKADWVVRLETIL